MKIFPPSVQLTAVSFDKQKRHTKHGMPFFTLIYPTKKQKHGGIPVL